MEITGQSLPPETDQQEVHSPEAGGVTSQEEIEAIPAEAGVDLAHDAPITSQYESSPTIMLTPEQMGSEEEWDLLIKNETLNGIREHFKEEKGGEPEYLSDPDAEMTIEDKYLRTAEVTNSTEYKLDYYKKKLGVKEHPVLDRPLEVIARDFQEEYERLVAESSGRDPASLAEDIGEYATQAAVGATADVAQDLANTAIDVYDFIKKHSGEFDHQKTPKLTFSDDMFPRAEHWGPNLVRDLSSWIAPYSALSTVTKGVKASTTAQKILKAQSLAAVVDFTAIDPESGSLLDLAVKHYPAVFGWIPQALLNGEDSDNVERRLRNSLDGLIIGPPAELAMMIMGFGLRQAKAVASKRLTKAKEAIVNKLSNKQPPIQEMPVHKAEEVLSTASKPSEMPMGQAADSMPAPHEVIEMPEIALEEFMPPKKLEHLPKEDIEAVYNAVDQGGLTKEQIDEILTRQFGSTPVPEKVGSMSTPDSKFASEEGARQARLTEATYHVGVDPSMKHTPTTRAEIQKEASRITIDELSALRPNQPLTPAQLERLGQHVSAINDDLAEASLAYKMNSSTENYSKMAELMNEFSRYLGIKNMAHAEKGVSLNLLKQMKEDALKSAAPKQEALDHLGAVIVDGMTSGDPNMGRIADAVLEANGVSTGSKKDITAKVKDKATKASKKILEQGEADAKKLEKAAYDIGKKAAEASKKTAGASKKTAGASKKTAEASKKTAEASKDVKKAIKGSTSKSTNAIEKLKKSTNEGAKPKAKAKEGTKAIAERVESLKKDFLEEVNLFTDLKNSPIEVSELIHDTGNLLLKLEDDIAKGNVKEASREANIVDRVLSILKGEAKEKVTKPIPSEAAQAAQDSLNNLAKEIRRQSKIKARDAANGKISVSDIRVTAKSAKNQLAAEEAIEVMSLNPINVAAAVASNGMVSASLGLNAFSNSLAIATRTGSIAFGRAKSIATQSGGIGKGEVLATLSGIYGPITQHLKNAGVAFVNQESKFKKMKYNRAFSTPDSHFALKAFDYFVNIPTRVLIRVPDEFFASMGYHMEFNRTLQKAWNKLDAPIGNKKEFFKMMSEPLDPLLNKEYLEKFGAGYNTLKSYKQQAAKNGTHYATVATFTSELDGWQKAINKGLKSNLVTRALTMFTTTGFNVLNMAYQSTPLEGAWRKTFGKQFANAAERDLAHGTWAFHSLVMGSVVGAHFADAIELIGSKPKDKEALKLWNISGKQEYSIRVGEKYYAMKSFGHLQPIFQVLANALDISSEVANHKDDILTIQGLLGATTLMATSAVTPEFFTMTMSDFLDAIASDDPDKMEALVKNLGTRLAPYSALARDISRQFDNKVYSAKSDAQGVQGLIEEYFNSIKIMYGITDNLPQVRNVLGEPLTHIVKAGTGVLNPFATKDVDESPLAEEILRLWPMYRYTQISEAEDSVILSDKQIHFPTRTVIQGNGSTKLTTVEYDRLQMWSGGHDLPHSDTGSAKMAKMGGITPTGETNSNAILYKSIVGGKTLREGLTNLIQSERYKKATEGAKRSMIQQTIHAAQKFAMSLVLREFPDIQTRVEENAKLRMGAEMRLTP